MLFNSYEFIFIFLPLTFVVYFGLNKYRLTIAGKAWLVFASLFFYSWWNVNYLPLIVGSMLFNYTLGNHLGSKKQNLPPVQPDKSATLKIISSRKSLLIAGISSNLVLLSYFKYADFLVSNLNSLGGNIDLPGIALPLAISFFTFQQIAYIVDRYRGESANDNIIDYALFVTFFPQLIAGPIVHHKEIMPQFASRWNWVARYRNITLGIFIFSMGLFKKVIIADTFATWATPGFDTATTLNFLDAWTTSLSYTFQLYFDFSGYTDMAIGAALLFNIRLPINFNSPYKALDIQDFWRRWHMTLSRFLRDYLYIPLGGNRHGESRTLVNLFATFLLGGLWHGASWMFVIWGAMHGAALVIHRLWSRQGFRMHPLLAWFLTFNFVNLAWVFFRAKDMDSALKIIHGMVGNYDISTTLSKATILDIYNIFANNTQAIYLCASLLIVLTLNNSSALINLTKPRIRHAVLSAFFIAIVIIITATTDTTKSEFLYFNF